MDRNYILGKEKEFKALMKLSIPATIAMLVNAIYNIIDTIFIGRGVGSLGIAGLSIYLPIQMIIMSVALLIGIGTSSIVSIKLGNNDLDGANKVSGNLFLIISIFSITLSIFGFLFAEEIVKIFGASIEVLPYAADYARTMFLGVLVFPFCVASNNLIRAEGNAKDSMNAMIIGMIANIFLDYILIYVFDFGIKGAGIATSISKGLTFVYMIYYFNTKSYIKIKLKYLNIDFNILKQIISIGSSAFITQAAMSLVALILNYSLYKYGGNQAVSVYGIVYKLTLFILMPLTGLVQGMQPIIGYSKGANNNNRINNILKVSIISSTIVSSVLTLVIFIAPKLIIGLFTTDTMLINEGSNVIKLIILIYPLIGIYQVAIGFYQSIGKGSQSLFLSLLRQIIFFIPLSFILPLISNLGLFGIWLAFPISDFLTILVTLIFIKYQSKDLSINLLLRKKVAL